MVKLVPKRSSKTALFIYSIVFHMLGIFGTLHLCFAKGLFFTRIFIAYAWKHAAFHNLHVTRQILINIATSLSTFIFE